MSGQRNPVLTGGCQCGAVRYALYAKPERVGICHCRMCQKAVGGPFFAWAAVNVTDIGWTRGAPAVFSSSSAADRGFCAQCGTPLTFRYLKRPDHISVTLGSLDDPAGATPSVVMGIESRLGWCATLLGSAPSQVTGEGGPPEDLSRITTYQHPDHDTPADWQPPAR
ncbi:MAG: GFA family protein [Acetobacteraceae bacterium]|jgi:hypothetical protein